MHVRSRDVGNGSSTKQNCPLSVIEEKLLVPDIKTGKVKPSGERKIKMLFLIRLQITLKLIAH